MAEPKVPPVQIKAITDGAKGKETPRPQKHIMISYQWECQEFAKDLYTALVMKGFNCWMDIQGGMYGNIFDSMARGVHNASLVIALLTPEYEKSPNCKRECELVAKLKIPIIPLKLTMFESVDWLSIAITAGTLWFDFTSRELASAASKKLFERVCDEILKALPDAVPRRTPTVFLSYSPKNIKYAEILKKHLKGSGKDAGKEGKDGKDGKDEKDGKDVGKESVGNSKTKEIKFKCILPRHGESKDKPKGDKKEGDKGKEGKADEKDKGEKKESLNVLQQREATESQIRSSDVIAVILILTPDFESDEDCKNDVNLAYSSRKFIIPTVWQPLKNGFPPKNLEFCLKALNYVDFTKTQIHNDTKVKLKVDFIKKLLKNSSSNSQLSSIITDKNFVIKCVGDWTEGDVTNWLRHINLHHYCQTFRSQHINGRLLLTLRESDLDILKVSKLHQRLFYSKIQELFHNFMWTEVEVAEWLDGLKLSDCKEVLFDSGVDGKSLLVLTESDLAAYGLTNKILQARLLQEISLLKLEKARVPAQKELYRFSVLKDVLVPVASDQLDKFRFSPDMLDLIGDIVKNVDSESQGLTQTGLKKFLFVLLMVAYVYKKSYPTKIIWHDATKVELVALRSGFLKDLLQNEADDPDPDSSKLHFDSLMTDLANDDDLDLILEGPIGELVVSLWLQYLTLDNIITRLFAVWDRMVNGILSTGELLAGLDLLIYGDIETKFKLASSLVDFNGDGSITPQEFAQFYKECFLPVLRKVRSRLIPDFNSLSKESLLYQIYNQIKDELDTDTRPFLLSNRFSIEEYTGGVENDEEERLGIHNVLEFSGHHCSKIGKNFDLILKAKNHAGFLLTNILIGGNSHSNCSAYVKDALVWFSKTLPDWKSYSEQFNDFTQEQFDAMPDDAPHKPDLLVSTDAEECLAEFELSPPIEATYIHIKLLRPHVFQYNNDYDYSSSSAYDTGDEEEGEEGKTLVELEEPKIPVENKDNAVEEGELAAGAGKNVEIEDGKSEDGKSEDGKSEDGKSEDGKSEDGKSEDGKSEDGKSEDGKSEDGDSGAYNYNIDCEFLGFWGFLADKRPEKPVEVSTNELYTTLGGITRDKAWEDQDNEELQSLNITPLANEFLKAAIEVADGQPLPESAEKLGIKVNDVEALLKQLDFVEPEAGGTQINQARSLMDLLPIIHLFRLFNGYPAMDILRQPM